MSGDREIFCPGGEEGEGVPKAYRRHVLAAAPRLSRLRLLSSVNHFSSGTVTKCSCAAATAANSEV